MEAKTLLMSCAVIRQYIIQPKAPVSPQNSTSFFGALNRIAKEIVAINLSALEVFENDAVVSVETLIEAGIVKNPRDGVKILGNGELTKKLTVKANAFSASAVAKIEANGGKAEVI